MSFKKFQSWTKVRAKMNWSTELLHSSQGPSPEHSLKNKHFFFFLMEEVTEGSDVHQLYNWMLISLVLVDWHCAPVVCSHDRISVFPVFSSDLLKTYAYRLFICVNFIKGKGFLCMVKSHFLFLKKQPYLSFSLIKDIFTWHYAFMMIP